MDKIYMAKITPGDSIKFPDRKHPNDAGMDLYSAFSISIPPGEVSIVGTGIVVRIPEGYFGWITNKSSKDYLIGGGIVDEGYQGELFVKIINPSNYFDVEISRGMAIAQLIILPCIKPTVVELSLPEMFEKKSDRGSTGGIVTQFKEKENG